MSRTTRIENSATCLGYVGLIASTKHSVHIEASNFGPKTCTLDQLIITSVSGEGENHYKPAESVTIYGYDAIVALYEFLGDQISKAVPPHKVWDSLSCFPFYSSPILLKQSQLKK